MLYSFNPAFLIFDKNKIFFNFIILGMLTKKKNILKKHMIKIFVQKIATSEYNLNRVIQKFIIGKGKIFLKNCCSRLTANFHIRHYEYYTLFNVFENMHLRSRDNHGL
ncbi:hypothetical protein NBO_36g0006 [Nosema bombycis CQ1]|uniref:Uncharacterized protein n=1 Tax=Nosema bombycis (strain CQ1 / CVCC 102059) TaxID=578461 RepID=R0MIW6_NOSB1|nr:hypothetical protein NBO_36g0006 [Nosema bombycis CQ1]|eukprot:EOB14145.1 hypothetical protein NBO_36g0006 [Nosema bombycis CQ1]